MKRTLVLAAAIAYPVFYTVASVFLDVRSRRRG